MSNFWDKESKPVCITKNDRGEEIQIKRVEKKGKEFVDVRTFYPGADGQMLPGKGISVPMGISDDVIQAMQSAKDAEY